MKTLKKILAIVLVVVTFFLLILFVVTRVQGKTPTLFGYQILRVVSPSMEPELMVGDVILTKTVQDVSTLEVGDIITYNGKEGSYAGKLITHEVVLKPYDGGDGTYYLQTQGIANFYADPEISDDQVVGKFVRPLPVFTKVYSFFMTPWGLVVILGFLAILFFNEIVSLVRTVKEKDSSSSNSEESAEITENSDSEPKSDLTE